MSKKAAIILMFFILGIVLIFHLLIFTEQIPYDKVWAGKLISIEEMKVLEAFSIVLNIFMLAVLYIKYRQLLSGIKNRTVNVLTWIFAGFFALNSVGNFFAESMAELIIGTSLTVISSILCCVIAKEEKTKAQQALK